MHKAKERWEAGASYLKKNGITTFACCISLPFRGVASNNDDAIIVNGNIKALFAVFLTLCKVGRMHVNFRHR